MKMEAAVVVITLIQPMYDLKKIEIFSYFLSCFLKIDFYFSYWQLLNRSTGGNPFTLAI